MYQIKFSDMVDIKSSCDGSPRNAPKLNIIKNQLSPKHILSTRTPVFPENNHNTSIALLMVL